MSFNSFGHLFCVTTWGESHGPALGATIDGCPPNVPIDAADIQIWLDKRKPGQNKFTTQRREADEVEILSGVFEGKTTGTPIQLMIRNAWIAQRIMAILPICSDQVTQTSHIGKNTGSEIIAVAGALLPVKLPQESQQVALHVQLYMCCALRSK